MAERYEYIDRCVAAVESINAAELEQRHLESPIGMGSSAFVYSVGELGVLGAQKYVALKLTTDRGMRNMRLGFELGQASVVVQRAPELADCFPSFMAMVTVTGAELALITEDASEGDTKRIRSSGISSESRAILGKAFENEGWFGTVFHRELNRSVAFNVGGAERFLDLTPGIFHPSYNVKDGTDLQRHRKRAREVVRQGKLSVTIGSESILARDIAEILV